MYTKGMASLVVLYSCTAYEVNGDTLVSLVYISRVLVEALQAPGILDFAKIGFYNNGRGKVTPPILMSYT